MSKTLSLFSLSLTASSLEEARELIDAYLSTEGFHHIVTANAEMLLYASRHPRYADTLRRASVRLVESFGVILVGRLRGQRLRGHDRATGVDCAHYILEKAARENMRALIVLPRKTFTAPDLMQRSLAARYTGLEFRLMHEETEEVAAVLQTFDPHIVFTAHGVPSQEEWIDRHRLLLTQVRIAMGVGGTFDFLSGTMQRAPQMMRSLGLEWAFRLLKEPKRIGRIVRATIVFPLKALLHK